MYSKKWKPSKKAVKEFKEKMEEIDEFCQKNGIIASNNNNSYYFNINGQRYRVSNHSIEASNNSAIIDGIQVRELYHGLERDKEIIYIHAGKTRIIEIYNNLKSGNILDGKGNVKY